jgi:hypothetical protein
MTFSELTNLMGVTTFEDLTNATTGVILLSNKLPGPIEYDLRGLIDTSYIALNNLQQTHNQGLNNRIIKRFNTIISLDSVTNDTNEINEINIKLQNTNNSVGDKLPCVGDKLPCVGDKLPCVDVRLPCVDVRLHCVDVRLPCVYVIESLANGLYRLLGYKHSTSNVVPVHKVACLLGKTSMRRQEYNRIQGQKIVINCFDTQSIYNQSEYDNKKVKRPPMDLLRTAISDKLMALVRVPNQQPHDASQQPHDASQQPHEVWNQHVVSNILLSCLPHISGSAGIHNDTEITISFLLKFSIIAKKYYSILIQVLESNSNILYKIPDSDEYKDQLRKILLTVFNESQKIQLWNDYDSSLKRWIIEKRLISI